MKTRPIFFLLFLSIISFQLVIAEENQASIKLGSSLALSGKLGKYGKSQLLGSEIYFKKINESGGIKGRKIELIAMDDQYDPLLSGKNVRELINKNHVLAFIGNIGSPNAIVTLPILNEDHVLLYAPQSGFELLYKHPPDRYVINFYISTKENCELAIKGLLDDGIKPEEIAFFTQNDPFGDAIYKASIDELKKLGYKNPEKLPYGRYNFMANMTNVDGGMATILREAREKKLNTKVIITGALPAQNAAFAKLAYQFIPNAIIVALPGSIYYNDFRDYEGNFIFSAFQPSPFDTNLEAIKEYQEDLKKYYPEQEPSDGSLYGYLSAKLFVIALRRAAEANHITTEGIIDAFESFRDIDIGIGVKITIDKNNHTAIRKAFPMLIKKGKPIPITWSDLSKLGLVTENDKNANAKDLQ